MYKRYAGRQVETMGVMITQDQAEKCRHCGILGSADADFILPKPKVKDSGKNTELKGCMQESKQEVFSRTFTLLR